MSPRRSAVEVRAILFRAPLSGLRRDLWCGEPMGIYFKAAGILVLLIGASLLFTALVLAAFWVIDVIPPWLFFTLAMLGILSGLFFGIVEIIREVEAQR